MKRYLCFLLMLMAFTVANAQTEICDNGIDDDGNGQIDCQDSACAFVSACRPREICDNGIDDDGDGQTDCEDGDCGNSINCENTQPTEICNNGIDDDNDGFIDYYDGDCIKQPTSLQRDSLALVALYHATDGDNWDRKDNWLTGPISSWYGVSAEETGVYGLELNSNNLQSELPGEINDLKNLYYFDFSDNDINALPSDLFVSSNASGHMLRNRLTFEDVVNQSRYFAKLDPQQLIGKDTTVLVDRGQTYTIDLSIDSDITTNQYIWFRNNIAFDTTNTNFYTLNNVNLNHTGIYTCQVTNSEAVTDLMLRSHPTHIQVKDDREAQKIQFDSLSNAFVGDTLLLQASASSGLPVIFEVSGPARLDDNQLILTDTGQITVTAQQPGDSLYLPAQNIMQAFWVKEATPSKDTSTFYSLSGSVWQAENVPFQRGTVVLYEVKLRYFALYTQELKDSHTYQFDSLPKGNYTIGVLVNDSSYLPTYWGEHYLMLNAEKISVQQDIETLDITLLSTPVAARGTAIIRGKLIGQKTNNGRLANAGNDEPLANVHVYLQNAQGVLVAHTVTNGQGQFAFKHLPEGEYRFVADYEGVAFPEKTIRAIKDQETVITASVAGDVSITSEEIVDQVTSTSSEITNKTINVFPNPATSTVSVKTDDIQWLGGTISLQNVVGRVVTQVPIQNTSTVMDIADQPAGIYLLTIRKNGTVETRKIVKQ